MDTIASWTATVATILAACMTASNLGSRITGYGFAVFTIGSIAWLTAGALTGQPALVWTNIVMTGLNLFGVWRWLGRQARLEEGGERAATRSRALESETLFPASRLTGGKVEGQDGVVHGQLVDGMIGCSSGRIAYVVIGDAGVTGIGETLRRADWKEVRIEGNCIRFAGDARAFAKLAKVQADNWPGR